MARVLERQVGPGVDALHRQVGQLHALVAEAKHPHVVGAAGKLRQFACQELDVNPCATVDVGRVFVGQEGDLHTGPISALAAAGRPPAVTLPRATGGVIGTDAGGAGSAQTAQQPRAALATTGWPHNPAMKAPQRLQSLIDEGLIDSVQRQLMSGKEANVYVVRCGDETRCAKVYKDALHRSFRQASDYTENRKVKNSRQARAMAKGTRFGREAQEAAWQSAEVDALYRLAAAGVRVPRPYNFHDGVLLMELVTDADGDAAPRLNDCDFTPAQAARHHATLMTEVVRMLCAGVVHGDLSEFNILLGADGPVIIDLPQAVDAAGNLHAQRMLLRDVANLSGFFGDFAPALRGSAYGPEIWTAYAHGTLHVDMPLTGRWQRPAGAVDLAAVMREIDDARAEEAARRMRMGAA